MVSLSRKTSCAAQVALQHCPILHMSKRKSMIPTGFRTVNWLNPLRKPGSKPSGQVAQLAPDRRLRRTGISTKFIDLYGIEADSLSEEDYEDFINDLIIDCCENETSPFDVEYETFTEHLSDYGGETLLDAETYEVAREQVEKLGIVAEYAFHEENDHSVTESFMFDAITGQYIK